MHQEVRNHASAARGQSVRPFSRPRRGGLVPPTHLRILCHGLPALRSTRRFHHRERMPLPFITAQASRLSMIPSPPSPLDGLAPLSGDRDGVSVQQPPRGSLPRRQPPPRGRVSLRPHRQQSQPGECLSPPLRHLILFCMSLLGFKLPLPAGSG